MKQAKLSKSPRNQVADEIEKNKTHLQDICAFRSNLNGKGVTHQVRFGLLNIPFT